MILDARVNEYEQFSNPPMLEVLVDTLPEWESFVWHFWDGIFWTERDGFIKFLAHDGSEKNLGGFYGQSFDIRMDDGSVKTLRGPWSGGSHLFWVRDDRPVEPIEVHVYESSWNSVGYAGYALTFSLAKEVLEKFCQDFEFVEGGYPDFWFPHRKSGCRKRWCGYCEERR